MAFLTSSFPYTGDAAPSAGNETQYRKGKEKWCRNKVVTRKQMSGQDEMMKARCLVQSSPKNPEDHRGHLRLQTVE